MMAILIRLRYRNPNRSSYRVCDVAIKSPNPHHPTRMNEGRECTPLFGTSLQWGRKLPLSCSISQWGRELPLSCDNEDERGQRVPPALSQTREPSRLACWHDAAASHTVVRAAFEHKAEVEGIIDFCSSREPTRLACWHGSAASHTVARAACEHEEEVEGIGDFCSSCEPSRLACWHQTRGKQGGNLTAVGEKAPTKLQCITVGE